MQNEIKVNYAIGKYKTLLTTLKRAAKEAKQAYDAHINVDDVDFWSGTECLDITAQLKNIWGNFSIGENYNGDKSISNEIFK